MLATWVQWVLAFENWSTQIFESSWIMLKFNSGKGFVHKATLRKSAVTLNHGYLLVSLPSCLRETICSQTDTPALRECLSWMDYLDCFISSSGECTKCKWVEFFPWKQAKLHTKTISRSASPKSTWLSCSQTVRRTCTDGLGVTLDDVTWHPGKLTLSHTRTLDVLQRARGWKVYKLEKKLAASKEASCIITLTKWSGSLSFWQKNSMGSFLIILVAPFDTF